MIWCSFAAEFYKYHVVMFELLYLCVMFNTNLVNWLVLYYVQQTKINRCCWCLCLPVSLNVVFSVYFFICISLIAIRTASVHIIFQVYIGWKLVEWFESSVILREVANGGTGCLASRSRVSSRVAS